jgi:hypothetical protein
MQYGEVFGTHPGSWIGLEEYIREYIAKHRQELMLHIDTVWIMLGLEGETRL